MATPYQTGATRQCTIRPSRERSPARPLSWAVTTTAATRGPKVPITVTPGSAGITTRAPSAARGQKNPVNAKAMMKYLSGKGLAAVVGADVVAVVSTSLSPFQERHRQTVWSMLRGGRWTLGWPAASLPRPLAALRAQARGQYDPW